MRYRVMLYLVIAVVAIGLLGANANSAEPIKLGAILPLGDITGQQGSKAMKLAVKEINAKGGLLGRKVELIVIDDEMKPEKGASAVEKLATVDKVDMFIGGMSSGVHLGQIPILKKYKKITVWAGAASQRCEQAMKGEDWYFHLHPWDYQQGASYIEGWTAIGKKFPNVKIKRWFYAYEEGAFGLGSYKGGKAGAPKGWEIMGEGFKSAAQGGGNYRSVLRHAKEAKPDIFIWVGYDADALPMLEQAKEIGFVSPIFAGSPPGWPKNFGSSPLADGVTLYGMWVPAIKQVSPVSKHFFDGYVKEFKEEPSTYFSPMCYVNVMFIAEGIKKAKTLESAALIKGLESVKMATPVGEVLQIKPSNIIKHQGFTKQKILQWQKGQQQVIWPFELKTATLRYPWK